MSKNVWDSCCQLEIPHELLENHPTPSDLQRNVSRELVEVYLKTCTSVERALFGRDKSLKGPGRLWINPDDRLSGNEVRLTPASVESIQALTHQNILEIGERLEVEMDKNSKMMMDKALEKAVGEALELAKFEANLRIKFHVEHESKKLNDEWEKRMNQLTMAHEEEVKRFENSHEDGRGLMRELSVRMPQNETDELEVKAVADSREQDEMEMKMSAVNEDEVAQQIAKLQEQMRNTLRNLEINDNSRMNEMQDKCLKALDLQSNLLACLEMTEMVHMMALEKQRCRMRMSEMKNEHEAIVEALRNKQPSRDHQSKSIKHLWMEFRSQLDDVDVGRLDDDEKEILDRFHQFHGQLMMEHPQLNSDGSDELFVIHEPNRSADDNATLDWIYRDDDIDCIRRQNAELASSVDVEWRKLDSVETPADASLHATVFNRFFGPQHSVHRRSSIITKIASSIMTLVRDVKDEKELEERIIGVLAQDVARKIDTPLPDVDVVLMPRAETLSIKDSLTVMEKRVSTPVDPAESHRDMLAAVDSLEIIKKSSSVFVKRKSSMAAAAQEPRVSVVSFASSSSSSKSCNVPVYMEVPKKPRCQLYAKMTDAEWKKLKKFEESRADGSSTRQSSVQFDDTQHIAITPRSSRRSSILKRQIESKTDLSQQQNILNPIQQKCRDAIKSMKIKSLLKLICDVNDSHI